LEKITISFVFRLPLEGFSWSFTPCTFRACATKGAGVVRSVSKWGHFICRRIYLFGCISVFMGGIFLKFLQPCATNVETSI